MAHDTGGRRTVTRKEPMKAIVFSIITASALLATGAIAETGAPAMPAIRFLLALACASTKTLVW